MLGLGLQGVGFGFLGESGRGRKLKIVGNVGVEQL